MGICNDFPWEVYFHSYLSVYKYSLLLGIAVVSKILCVKVFAVSAWVPERLLKGKKLWSHWEYIKFSKEKLRESPYKVLENSTPLSFGRLKWAHPTVKWESITTLKLSINFMKVESYSYRGSPVSNGIVKSLRNRSLEPVRRKVKKTLSLPLCTIQGSLWDLLNRSLKIFQRIAKRFLFERQ